MNDWGNVPNFENLPGIPARITAQHKERYEIVCEHGITHARLKLYRDILLGYDAVAHLTEEERKAVPYVLLANQFVCVAWFSEQEKYADIFETNKKMTLWLLSRLEQLKDF